MVKRVTILTLVALSVATSCGAPEDGAPQARSGNYRTESVAVQSIAPTENGCQPSPRCDQLFCEQVRIDGGAFGIGSDEEPVSAPPSFFGGLDHYGPESPRRTVILADFCIDVYEVTIERYAACVLAGVCAPDGCRWPDDPVPVTGDRVHVNHLPERCEGDPAACSHHPVNCKTHAQAEAYCRWIGRRLCTEAEWERAAKGSPPRERRYPWGDAQPSRERVNTGLFGPGFLEPVDGHPAGRSPEGAFNLIGNVYEWVADRYRPERDRAIWVADARPDGRLPEYRVARGGCFLSTDDQTATTRTILEPSFDWG